MADARAGPTFPQPDDEHDEHDDRSDDDNYSTVGRAEGRSPIADELGYRSRASARSAVVRGLQRWMEPAEALRAMELDRAEMLGRELVALLQSDDPDVKFKAINGILRVMDYMAKITGLYIHARPKRPKHDPAMDSVWSERGREIVDAVLRFMELTGQANGNSSPTEVRRA